MARSPRISVVISAYNDFPSLRRLLADLFKSKFKSFEVVIVDDASQEDLSKLKEYFPQIRYFRNKINLGVAETRNLGARLAKGKIILSLDNDVVPFGDLIFEVAKFFEKNPKAIAVTGFPGTGAENEHFFAKFKYLRDYSYWYLDSDPGSFYYFRPAIGAIKKEVFLALKGYDGRYCRPGVPAVEDLEFSYRLSVVGKTVFDPKLVVGHPFGGLRKLVKTYFKRTAIFFEILRKNLKFSGVATTGGEAFTIIFSVLSLASILGTLAITSLLWVFVPSFIWFIFLQRRFLSLCFEREGLLFSMGAFLTSWFLYIVIVAGAVYAIFEYLLENLFKEELEFKPGVLTTTPKT